MAQTKGEIIFATNGNFGQFKNYVRDGIVITRKRTNLAGDHTPTEAQMAQRVSWANVVSAYRAMDQGDDLHPSFENRKRGVTDYNVFTSINAKRTKVFLTAEEVQMGACVLDNWVCSAGSLLPSINATKVGDNFISDIELGSLEITDATTVARFSRFVRRHNPDRFEYGDEIAFFFAQQKVNPTTNMPYVGVVAGKVTLDAGDEQTLRNVAGELGFSVVESGGKRYLGCQAVEDSMVVWIQSRINSNGSVSITTQQLVGDNSLLAAYTSPAARAKAVETYRKALRKEFLRPGANKSRNEDLGTDEEDTGEMPPSQGNTPTITKVVIATAVSPAGAGTVSGAGAYNPGTEVTLTATASNPTDKPFTKWSDGVTQNPRTVTATANATYTAIFGTPTSGGDGGID